jgi:surface antigen
MLKKMRISNLKVITAITIVIVAFSLLPLGKTQDETPTYTSSFLLLNRPDGNVTYELNVTISQTLYQYYRSKSHVLFSLEQFGKFVTPYTLKPIADSLWQIYDNQEDFTNGVLMLVHQIKYEETLPGKYPVETLVEGKGDCDLFALIAASILKAGGINTVLLYYEDELHMQIGVELASAPNDARNSVYFVNHQNVKYYIGECTGTNWRNGWRIGECPPHTRTLQPKS